MSFFADVSKLPSDLVDLLVQTSLYDMAFTVLLKFFKGSDLKRFFLFFHVQAIVSFSYAHLNLIAMYFGCNVLHSLGNWKEFLGLCH